MTTARPGGAIRLLTANLFHDRADPEAFAAQLRELAVDVACFQELGARQAAAIARVLPYGKLEPGATRRDFNGMGIAARRPLAVSRLALPRRDARIATLSPNDWPELGAARRPIAVMRLALPRRDARIATLSPNDWPELGAALELVNLHIQAPHTFPQWRAFATRRAQLAALLPYLDATPEAPRVVCGDFNATPLWPAYRALTARLPDLALEHAALRRERPRRTWGPWPGAPRALRIDHVLGNGVLAANVQVVRVRGSDHAALVVDLVREA